VARAPHILFDPAFQARLLRGDSQILGRHVLALALSSELSDEVSAGVSWLQSPVDGSGLVATTFTWVPSDVLTLALTGLAPWGVAPSGGVPRSEWGATPLSVLVQARVYD
jgi:hypothetical protein